MTTSVQERAVAPVPGTSAEPAVRPVPRATPWRLVTDSAGVSAIGPRGPVGGADLAANGDVVRVGVWLDGGVLPHQLRGDLARSIGGHPALHPGRQVVAALPHGEAELLVGLRSQLCDVRTRVAGTTCLLEGRVR